MSVAIHTAAGGDAENEQLVVCRYLDSDGTLRTADGTVFIRLADAFKLQIKLRKGLIGSQYCILLVSELTGTDPDPTQTPIIFGGGFVFVDYDPDSAYSAGVVARVTAGSNAGSYYARVDVPAHGTVPGTDDSVWGLMGTLANFST